MLSPEYSPDVVRSRNVRVIPALVFSVLAVFLSTLLAVSVVTPQSKDNSAPMPPKGVSTPVLASAGAMGTFKHMIGGTNWAVFRVACGWSKVTDKALPQNQDWLVNMKNMAYDEANDPGNLAASHEINVSRADWLTNYSSHWHGYLILYGPPFLTDGPSTDVCHGILG